ncbi:hypothetical protein G3R49_00710 [Shewanella sp. WXL01]|uniref:hypothetical protein n=1 Tax=Shewanella sp. WXL01 TaxID=2709721 RepID=UPI0014384DAF|nr:hypothetical protein [Shewanella sp. WXL01]NKF49095.1 hypothetical protein [Shewanella sp. WXL01]
MKFILIWGLAMFSTSVLGDGFNQASIRVGADEIIINYPMGFVDACEKSEDYSMMFSSGLPPEVSLAGCYIGKEEFELYPELKPEMEIIHLSIQNIKHFENLATTPAEFAKFSLSIEEQQSSLYQQLPSSVKDIIEKASDTLTEVSNEKVVAEIKGIVPLGILSKSDRNIAFSIIRNLEAKDHEGSTSVTDVVVFNTVLKDEKVLLLYVSTPYENSDDIKKAQELAIYWGENI